MIRAPEITTLAFDWGNTLMRTFPEYSGAMVDWPRVEAVQGIPLVLAELRAQYDLVVASNAIDSNAAQIRAALERVKAGAYFRAIYSFHEMKVKKPDPEFFAFLETTLNICSSQAVMIGDDLQVDCLGAHDAGWRSIWYNPQNVACPGLLPIHNAEICHMDQLPGILKNAFYPSYEECLSWLLQAQAPHNLLAHIHTVSAIGYQLALWLRQSGHSVDPILVHRGGLLHDIAKVEARRMGEDKITHSELGEKRLSFLNQPVLAQITRRHQLDNILDERHRPQTIEESLVFFADKLANGSHLVTPDERITILSHRYPDSSAVIEKTRRPVLELQTALCKKMNIPEADLLTRIKKALSNKPA